MTVDREAIIHVLKVALGASIPVAIHAILSSTGQLQHVCQGVVGG